MKEDSGGKVEEIVGIAAQNKLQAGVVYYLRMLLLIVFCSMVMIFLVSCLSNILHFIPSLRGRNLFSDCEKTVASL